jgi:hypothetical protein
VLYTSCVESNLEEISRRSHDIALGELIRLALLKLLSFRFCWLATLVKLENSAIDKSARLLNLSNGDEKQSLQKDAYGNMAEVSLSTQRAQRGAVDNPRLGAGRPYP